MALASMTKKAVISQAQANLRNAQAGFQAAAAEVERAKVSAADLKLDYDRKRKPRTKASSQ